jgi:hypothetical protein
LREVEVSVIDRTSTRIYFGEHGNSKVIGWSTYLQSAAVGSYENVDKLASEVFRQNARNEEE